MTIRDYDIETIVFFSEANNGDTHIVRSYVRDIMLKLPHYSYKYKQNKSVTYSFLLDDIDGLQPYVGTTETPSNSSLILNTETKTLYISTWVGQRNYEFFGNVMGNRADHVSFHIVHNVFTSIYRFLDIPINGVYEYIPTVYFDGINTSEVNTLVSKLPTDKKLILVSNNDVKSGQSENFDFDLVFSQVTSEDTIFLFTNPTKLKRDNIIHIGDYISFPNLNKISYLSTFCDVIIGRSSGPYTFSIIKENLFNPNKTFVCFTYGKIIGTGLYDGEYSCKYVWSDDFSTTNVVTIIKSVL